MIKEELAIKSVKAVFNHRVIEQTHQQKTKSTTKTT